MATTVLLRRHVPSHDHGHGHLDHNQDGLNYDDSASSRSVVSDSASCGRNASNTTSREDRDMDLDNTRQSIATTATTSSCSTSTAKDMFDTSTRSRDVSILDFSPEDEDENEEGDEETVADDDSMRSNGNNHNNHNNSSIIMFKELHVELHQEGVDDDHHDDSYDSNGTTKKASTRKHPKTQETSSSSTSPSSSSSRGIMDIGGISSLYSVTDTLVDSLCSSSSSSSLYPYPCNSNNNNSNNNNNNKGGSNTTRSTSPDTNNEAKINGTSAPQPHKSSGETNDTASVAPLLSGDFCVSGSDFGCDGGGGFGGGTGSSLTPAINDILQLLNCTSQPSQSEWDNIWSIKTKDVLRSKQKNQVQDDNRPSRAPIRKRLKRLHALRMMSHGIRGSSRHGVTFADQDLNTSFTADRGGGGGIIGAVEGIDGPIGNSTRTDRTQVEASVAQPFVLDKSYTMTDNTPSFGIMGSNDLGKTMASFDGYDSDPELNCSMTMDCKPRQHQQHTSFSSPDVSADLGHCSANAALSFNIEDDYPSHKTQEGDDLYSSSPRSSMETTLDALDVCGMDDNEVQNSVQATLNSTWTLTWHPNPDNMKDFSMSHQPVCTNIWLERGTVINNSGVVIEPAFMWRDAYQPNLTQRRQLNASTQKPWTMRLLNACRIAPCSSLSEIDRSKYPLARPSCCFFLKSCSGQEYLFEAQSTDEMKMITQQWKMAVARFASLAVTEDVSGIANEFFHPTLDSQVLTLDSSGAY